MRDVRIGRVRLRLNLQLLRRGLPSGTIFLELARNGLHIGRLLLRTGVKSLLLRALSYRTVRARSRTASVRKALHNLANLLSRTLELGRGCVRVCGRLPRAIRRAALATFSVVFLVTVLVTLGLRKADRASRIPAHEHLPNVASRVVHSHVLAFLLLRGVQPLVPIAMRILPHGALQRNFVLRRRAVLHGCFFLDAQCPLLHLLTRLPLLLAARVGTNVEQQEGVAQHLLLDNMVQLRLCRK
mmetsp:Transcript_108864/g.306791  ORF Transcript_108864/g.306791 Transcript_108864/m.306791 type:complete len:242 (+) Transcript_108864:1273-1998(+)